MSQQKYCFNRRNPPTMRSCQGDRIARTIPLSNGKHSFSSELTGTVTLVSVLSIKRKGGCVAGIEQPEHHGYRVGESSAGTAMIRDSKRQGCANPKLKNNIFSVTSHSCAGMLN